MSTITTEEPRWPELHKARRAIVVVDVVESVRLMQQHEDDVIDRWRRFVHEVRTEVLPPHGGRLVKSLGDGMLLEFGEVRAAVAAALALQRLVARYNSDRSPDNAISLRAGIHLAEVVVDELDIYGSGVNIAARLAGVGAAGQTLASDIVVDHLVIGIDAEVEDLGPTFLKHVEQPLRAYRLVDRRGAGSGEEVRWRPLDDLRTAVAVVPLTVSGADSDVVGDLVADCLIAALGTARDLRLLSRLSTRALRYRPDQLEVAAGVLRAAYVVSGSAAVSGRQVTLNIEVCEVQSATVVENLRRRLSLAELLEEDGAAWIEMGNAVHTAIVNLELRRARVRPLPNLSSYALQLSAVVMMHRTSREGFDDVKEMLGHLADRHGRHPEPRAWLAKWYVLRLTRGWGEAAADADRALQLTRAALDADPDCALALAVEGFVLCHLRRDLGAAEQRYDAAIAAQPSEALAWLYRSVLHVFRGEGASAWADSQRALALSPLDPMRYYFLSLAASAAVAAGRYDDAVDLAQRSIALNSQHSSTFRALAIAHALQGDTAAARAAVNRLLVLEPGFTVQSFVRRSPSSDYPAGRTYAQALRDAGLPEGAG